MSRLKIKDMPPVEVVDGTEIIPTGGKGDVSVTVERIKNYVYAGTNFTSLASQLQTVDLRSQNNKVAIDSHIADLLNPHQVTKSQVGLGNVDNTSDLNKPISTATQTALTTLDNTKANTTYVDAGLNTKANITYVDDNLALKEDNLVLGATDLVAASSFDNVKDTNNLVIDATNQALLNRTEYLKTHNNLVGRDSPSSHPASAILDSSGKTQQEINDFIYPKLQRELVSIWDFFTAQELTAYKSTPTTFDASRPLQAFFDYITANDVGTANANGDFRTSKQINFNAASKTQQLIGTLKLLPLVGFTGSAVFHYSPGKVRWYGTLDLYESNYTYANRRADVGLIFGGGQNSIGTAYGSYAYISRIVSGCYKQIGVKFIGASTGASVDTLEVYGNGSGQQTSAYSYPATTISNRVDNNSGGTDQYTELNVSVLPPENLQTGLHLSITVGGTPQLYRVDTVDRVNSKIRIGPILDRTVTTDLSATYVFGAGVYSEGGDSSVINIKALQASANSYGVWQGSLYPACIGSLTSETNFATLALGRDVSAAVLGGSISYFYTESNIFDFVRVTRANISFAFLNDVTFNPSKFVSLGALRHPSVNEITGYNTMEGLRGSVNGSAFKYQHQYFYQDQAWNFDITDTNNVPRIQAWGDYSTLTIPISTPNVSNALYLGYNTRKMVIFGYRSSKLAATNTLTFTAPTGYVFQNGTTSISQVGLVGMTEITFVIDVLSKKIYVSFDHQAALPLSATATYDPPSLSAGAVQSTTVTLTGAVVGNAVVCSFSLPLNGTRMWAEVTAANTVTVYHQNPTGAAVDLASGTLTVKLI